MQPARTADNSAVFVVPNVKVRMEAQHSIPPMSLHDLFRKTFTFTVANRITFPLDEETNKCTYDCLLTTPSATILMVYSIKEYNKKLCVTNQYKICLYKTLLNSKILYVIMIKWLKVVFVGRRISCCIGRSVHCREAELGLPCTERPIKQEILRPTNTTFNHFIMITSRILVQDLSS